MKVFVGTAEEYKEVAHLFGEASSHPELSPANGAANRGDKNAHEVGELTADIVERGLTRIPLSDQQCATLNAIVEANPGWINTKELAKATGMTRQQIAGVWGALGRRFSNTKGWPRGQWPITDRWDAAKSLWCYQAKPVLCELVRQGRIKLK
jgi:hypothetical protein